MSTLQIKPLDTLFFKDGRPFSMGEETWAVGVFPPYPSAFYGLLRSIYLSNGNTSQLANGTSWNDTSDPSLQLKISGLLPTIGNEIHFPIPNDLYGIKGSKSNKAKKLRYADKPDNLISDYEFAGLLETNELTKVQEWGGKALLDQTEFESWLRDDSDCYVYKRLSDHVLDEPKIGIGRNPSTRTAATAQLYLVNMRRMHSERKNGAEPYGFMIEYDGLTLPDDGLSRFGAEIKAVEYVKANTWDVACPVNDDATHFKIYLATPAVFEDGVFPSSWNTNLKLLTAAIGRVQHIGGFDMKAVQPKPMRKAVPAGTVFYVQCENGKTAKDFKHIHGKSIYDLAPNGNSIKNEYQRQGFGHCYLGNFKMP